MPDTWITCATPDCGRHFLPGTGECRCEKCRKDLRKKQLCRYCGVAPMPTRKHTICAACRPLRYAAAEAANAGRIYIPPPAYSYGGGRTADHRENTRETKYGRDG